MPWLYLALAGLLEVVWALSMKQSEGFTRTIPTFVMIVAMIGSFWLLAASMKTLPLGTAYTVWTGIGAVGAFAAGLVMFGETNSILRSLAATMIVSGLVLMWFAGES